MRCLYYPGCSQKASSRSYEQSFLAVCGPLGIDAVELDDWNCCGTTAAISVNKVLAISLAARNLALAEPMGLTMVTPCPSCRLSLARANEVLSKPGPLADKVRETLAAAGLTYSGGTIVRHVLEFLVHRIGLEKIRQNVRMPLTGVRIAPYYGCQVVRPYAEGDDAQNPQNLERIIEALGGEVADFQLRTTCCGGALMATKQELAQSMSGQILKSIRQAGADVVVTPCGLCQVNLELAQRASKSVVGEDIRMPILNLTQLVGLAFGLAPEQLALYATMVRSDFIRTLISSGSTSQAGSG